MQLPGNSSCVKCHRLKSADLIFICKAFPVGIPDKILTGERDHTKPFPGDNGILFEPIKESKK